MGATARALATVFFSTVLTAGCGAPSPDDVSQAGAGTDGSQAGGADAGGGGGGAEAPGLPGGGGGEAPGAPIVIPSVVQDQGRPLAEVLAEMDASIREQCGGELCLSLRVEPLHTSFSECQFVATRPPQETEIARGSTVVVVAGTQPCGEAPDGTTEESTEEGSEESTEEAPEESTEVTPEESTEEAPEESTDDGTGETTESTEP